MPHDRMLGAVVKQTDLNLGDGRRLHVYDTVANDTDSRLVVFWHHGTPNIGAPPEPLLPADARIATQTHESVTREDDMSIEQSRGAEPPVGNAGSATAEGASMQILSTEHCSLLATRSLGYTDFFGRTNVFFSVLSGTVIALALLLAAIAALIQREVAGLGKELTPRFPSPNE
jgi:hypothetical protein